MRSLLAISVRVSALPNRQLETFTVTLQPKKFNLNFAERSASPATKIFAFPQQIDAVGVQADC